MTTFFVPGTPIPQGSMRVVRGRIISDNPKLKAWRREVARHAVQNVPWRAIDTPVTIRAAFVFPRLKTARNDSPLTKSTRPDVDKLCRAIGDALEQDAGILKEDSRITTWHATKRYAAPGEPPGAHITITTQGDTHAP